MVVLILIIAAPLIYKHWRGNQIAFVAMNDEGRVAGLFQMNVLGGQPKLINSGNIAQPAYSPDGQKIAFVSSANERGDAPYHISIMDSNGTNIRQLTTGETRNATS
jgi:Tol biopolymer transport system component